MLDRGGTVIDFAIRYKGTNDFKILLAWLQSVTQTPINAPQGAKGKKRKHIPANFSFGRQGLSKGFQAEKL